MSLLLDALKQAEKQKNAEKGDDIEQQERATDSVELSIDELHVKEPVLPAFDAEPNKQSLVSENKIQFEEVEEIEKVRAERISEPQIITNKPPLSTPTIAAEVIKSQEAATGKVNLDPSLNVFAVGNGQSRKGSHKKALTIAAAIITILLLMAGVWYYLENGSTNEAAEQVLDEAPVFDELEEQRQQNTKEVEAPEMLLPSVEKASSNFNNTDAQLIADPQDKSASTAVETGIKIKKRVISDGVYSQLDSAYAALQSGDLARAKLQYLSVLKLRPKQIDALLGLANIETRQGAVQRARELYEKVLVQEGANTVAQVGLLQTYSDKAPLANQQVLENLSSKYPSNVNILMALGQSYSAQSKWIKAQEIYFKCFSLQPTNASFAYNLGVSLDQLGKISAAITYYKKALGLNQTAFNPIDMSAVTQRLQELGEGK